MKDVIEVNISALEHDSDYVAENLTAARKEVEKIYGIVANLNGMWNSEAKKVYVDKLVRSRTNLEELLEEAIKTAEKITDAVEVYKQCEIEIAGEIDEINI